MLRFCFVSLAILVLSVVLVACGQSFRNCSQSYAQAYNDVHNFIFIYSRASKDPQEFQAVRQETETVCRKLETEHEGVQCMALKQGVARKISYEDFRVDCTAVQSGERIPRKH